MVGWSFTLADLSTTAPSTLGAQPLAPDQGATAVGDTVIFVLPSGVVAPDSALYLGLLPVSDNGVNYFNNDGATPPRLVVRYR